MMETIEAERRDVGDTNGRREGACVCVCVGGVPHWASVRWGAARRGVGGGG